MSHKEELVQDVRKLVKQLTGFEDDDENLRRCESYALSNILYHRYVSVEGRKVRKAMDGLVTKLFVHGHLQTSKRLSELFEKFLKDEKFEDPSHCDEQWSALWLLLCLANRPTDKIQPDETPEPVKENNDDENFDWGAYLMDGVAPFSRPYDDDSDEYFSELGDSGVSSVDEAFTHTSTLSVGLKSTELESTSRNEELVELVNKGVEAERWLKQNVQNCWWITGNVPNEVHSKYPCANFAESWEAYSVAERNNEGCCRPSTIKISEYKVVREVLFMLHSPSATFLFHEENGCFVIRNDVTIPSLSKDAVKNYLGHVCEYVNIVYELQKFREAVYTGYQTDSSLTTRLPTFTFEAYAASLHDILQEFAQFISKIEARVRKQEDINTLYQLICELRPKFKELKVVYDTHVLATEDWKESPNWLAVTRLLSVLYEAGISATEAYESRHILKLFLKSFRPYFGIISTWLTEGQLEDWRQEFIITRNDDVIDRSWEIWEEGFTLHPYINCLKSKGIEPLPLLEDVAEKVLHAGKSIELLKKLNKIGDFSHLSDMKGSLYKEFLIAIIKELPVNDEQKQKNGDNESHFNSEEEQKEVTDKKNTIEDHISLTTPHASVVDASTPQKRLNLNLSEERPLLDYPVLGKIVKKLFQKEDKLAWQDIGQMEEQELFDKVIQKLSCGCFPVKPLLECVFSYFIYEKHGTACSLVKNILHSEYNIAVQLSVVRNIYLMEGSDMEKFCSHVFSEVERNYAWDNAYSLTMQLENCIDERYPSLSSKFSVSVSKRSETIVSVNTLDSIKIKFSVECPMSLIFSKVNMKMYNSVFRFLLKVKWALWALEQLRFKRGEMKDNIKAESGSNIRKHNMLWLLRFWMLHSIGCLHSYLMGQVLVSLGLELERDIEEAADLDTLIRVHNNYVQKVYTHCLQPKEYEDIRRAILELVTLALKLREVWLVGLEIVSEERLGKMGDLYIKCHTQLGAVLQNAVDANHDPLRKCMTATRTQPLVYHLPCDVASPDESLSQLYPHCGDTTRNTVQQLEREPQSDADDVLTTFLRNMLLSYKQTTSFLTHIDEDSFVFRKCVAAFHFSVENRKYFPGLYDSQCAEFFRTSWCKKSSGYKNIHSFSYEKMFYNTRSYKHSKITKRRLYLSSGHSFVMKSQNCVRMSRYKFKSEIMVQRKNFISLPSLKKRIKLFSNSDLPQSQMSFSKSDTTLMNKCGHRVKKMSTQKNKTDVVNDNTYRIHSLGATEDGTDGPTSDEFITGTNHSTRSISYVSATTSTEMNEAVGICNVSTETIDTVLSANVPVFRHTDKSSKKASLIKRNYKTFSRFARSEFHEVHSDSEEIGNVPNFRYGKKSSKKTSLKKRNCTAFLQAASSKLHEVHSDNEEIGTIPIFKHGDKSSKKVSVKKRNYQAVSQTVRSKLQEVHSGNEEIGNSRELTFENNPIFHSYSVTKSTIRYLPPLIKSKEACTKNLCNDDDDDDDDGYDADCDTADSESVNSNSDLEDWLDLLLFNSKTDVSSKSKSTQYTSASEYTTETESKCRSSYYSIANDKSHSELCLVTNSVSESSSDHKIKRCSSSSSVLNTISHRKVFSERGVTQRYFSGDDYKVFNSVDTIQIERQYTAPCVSTNTSSEYMAGVESKSCNSQGSVSLPKICTSACTNSEYSYEADGSETSTSPYTKMFPPVDLAPSCYWRENDQPKGRHVTVLHENKKCLQNSLSELELTGNIADQRIKQKQLLEKQATSIPARQISSTHLTGPLCRTCVFKCGLLPQNGKTVRGQEILQHLLETDKKLKKQENKQCLSQMEKKSKFCSKCRSLFTKNA